MQQIYNPYQQYQRQKDVEVRTATPVQLIGMLLEGAILFNKKAIMALEDGRKINALEFADRACKIVSHLYNCLDFDQGGEIADKLGSLYSFMLTQYVEFARRRQEPELLQSINRVLEIILQGWKQIEGKTG